MSKYRAVTVTCWCVTALAAVFLAAWFIVNMFTGFGDFGKGFSVSIFDNIGGTFEPVGEYTAPADGIEDLTVNWVSSDVTLNVYSGNEIIITEYAKRSLRDGEDMVVTNKNGAVTVDFTSKNIMFNMAIKRLEIQVPESIAKSFKRLDIESVSGGITLSDINTVELVLGTVSGRIFAKNITADKAGAESTSGGIILDALTAGELRMTTTSGRIECTEVTAPTLSGESVSGSQSYTGSFTDIRLDSVSGKISLNSEKLPYSINAETVSGGIELYIPTQDESITVSHDAVSGKFSSDAPVIMQNRDARYNFSQVSGSTRIYTK